MRAQHFAAPGNLKPFCDSLFSLAAGDGFRHRARKIILAPGMTNLFCRSESRISPDETSPSLPHPPAEVISNENAATQHLDLKPFAVMLHVIG
jgi:hypothetical protein